MVDSTKTKDWLGIEKLFFTLFIGCVLVGAIYVATDWPIRASIIILLLGGIGIILVLAQLVADYKNIASGKEAQRLSMEAPAVESAGRWGNAKIWGWLLCMYALVHLIGFPAAVPLFVLAYIKIYGGGWMLALTLASVAWGFVHIVFDRVLHVPWPEPLLSFLIS